MAIDHVIVGMGEGERKKIRGGGDMVYKRFASPRRASLMTSVHGDAPQGIRSSLPSDHGLAIGGGLQLRRWVPQVDEVLK